MFQCANDECTTKIRPGMKPVQVVTKVRTVGYVESTTDDDVELIGTGKETAQEVLLCKTCAEIAEGHEYEVDVVGHKVIDHRLHRRTGKLLRVKVKVQHGDY